MIKNKVSFFIIVIITFVILSYFYYSAVEFVKISSFTKIERLVTLNRHDFIDEKFDFVNDSYSLRVVCPYNKSQNKSFYFNGTAVSPIYTRIRGENEASYIYLSKKIVNDGKNLLRIKFHGSSPPRVSIRITNYYSQLLDSIFIVFLDSNYYTLSKVNNGNAFLSFLLGFFIYWALIYLICKFFWRRFYIFILCTTLFFVPPLLYNLYFPYKLLFPDSVFWSLLLIPIFLLCLFLILGNLLKQQMSIIGSLDGGFIKKHKIIVIGKIILFGFIVSVVFHLIKCKFINAQYPNDTFLFIPRDRFNDFFSMYDCVKNMDPYNIAGLNFNNYGAFRSSYYPFANIVFYVFTLFSKIIAIILYLGMFLVLFFYSNASNLIFNNKQQFFKYLCIFSFISYPILFALDRGNIEIYVLLFLLIFVYFNQIGRSILGAVFLAFAISMKAYPAVFLILYLSEKKYREIILTIVFVILLTVLSLMFHKGGFFINFKFMLSGFDFNSIPFLCHSNNIVQRGVSLFTLAKMYFIQTNTIVLFDMVKFLGIYIKVAISVFIILSGYVVFIEKELWKKVMILVSVALLLPHASADYKLIFIFIPMLMFINSNNKSRFDLFYMVMFGLLLIPKDYLLFSKIVSDTGYNDISIAVVLNIFIILAMMVVIIAEGFSKWLAKRKAAHIEDFSYRR